MRLSCETVVHTHEVLLWYTADSPVGDRIADQAPRRLTGRFLLTVLAPSCHPLSHRQSRCPCSKYPVQRGGCETAMPCSVDMAHSGLCRQLTPNSSKSTTLPVVHGTVRNFEDFRLLVSQLLRVGLSSPCARSLQHIAVRPCHLIRQLTVSNFSPPNWKCDICCRSQIPGTTLGREGHTHVLVGESLLDGSHRASQVRCQRRLEKPHQTLLHRHPGPAGLRC